MMMTTTEIQNEETTTTTAGIGEEQPTTEFQNEEEMTMNLANNTQSGARILPKSNLPDLSPYGVFLRVMQSNSLFQILNVRGALISNSWVLTAAKPVVS